MSRSTAPVGEVIDHLRQEWQFLFAAGIEQAFCGQPLLALLQHRHQGAGPGQIHLLDNQLVTRRARIGGDPAGTDHIQPGFGLEGDGAGALFPDDGVEDGFLVLEIKVNVPGSGEFQPRNLAPHPHKGEILLHRALQGGREFADRKFGQIWQIFGSFAHAV